MPYRTRHICTLFDISEETVRVWVNEFQDYLSPTATPGKHKQRLFTDPDMRVMAFVAEMKKLGRTFAEIHISLRNGQRGVLPALPPEEMDALVSTDREGRLAFENEHLERELVQAHEQLKIIQRELDDMRNVQNENIRLKAQLESSLTHQDRLEAMVDRLTKRIEEMSLQVGREVARGIVDALRDRDDKPIG